MDVILGAIQGYEGKTNATLELMLKMKKKFNGKLEALEQDNNLIEAQLSKGEEYQKRRKVQEKKKNSMGRERMQRMNERSKMILVTGRMTTGGTKRRNSLILPALILETREKAS